MCNLTLEVAVLWAGAWTTWPAGILSKLNYPWILWNTLETSSGFDTWNWIWLQEELPATCWSRCRAAGTASCVGFGSVAGGQHHMGSETCGCLIWGCWEQTLSSLTAMGVSILARYFSWSECRETLTSKPEFCFRWESRMLVDPASPKANRRASGNTGVDTGCCCQKTPLCSFLLVFWSRQCRVEQILGGKINIGGQGQIGCDAKGILKRHRGTLFFRQPCMTHLLVQHWSLCVTTVNLRWWLSGSCTISRVAILQ